VWSQGRAFVSQTYATQRITTQQPDKIEFTLTFDPWDAAGLRVSEEKTVRMVSGTNFFQVVHTIKTAGDVDVTVGIGLSTFGQPRVAKDEKQGRLACWEKVKPDHGALGTAVVVEPRTCAGYAQTAKEEFVLIKVKSNQPFTYFVGAGWKGNARFKAPGSWDAWLQQEADWAKLNALYNRQPANR
jgi:hypothetical protein